MPAQTARWSSIDRPAKLIAGLRDAFDASRVLCPELIANCPERRDERRVIAVDHIERTGAGKATHGLERHTDRQIRQKAIAEIPGRQRRAKPFTDVSAIRDVLAVLRPHLIPGTGLRGQ